jgi:ABC-type lipoprotein release transport system permease subunit
MPLGAQPAAMLPGFLKQGLLLAAIGVGVGLAVAAGLTRLRYAFRVLSRTPSFAVAVVSVLALGESE